jgi:hypothetical protein
MSTFVDELTNAAREGQKKRKRIAEFEQDLFKEKLTKEWTLFRKAALEEAGSSGATCHIMPLDFSKNREFRPFPVDIWDNLPEDLEKLRHTEGCNVRLEHGTNGAHTWEVIVSITGRVNALNDKDLKAETKESDTNQGS